VFSTTSRASGGDSIAERIRNGSSQVLVGARRKTRLARERSRADLIVPAGAVTAGRGWPTAVKEFRMLMEPPVADRRVCDLYLCFFRSYVAGLSRLIECVVTERRTGWCNFVPVAS
jgi:hypothetical protein